MQTLNVREYPHPIHVRPNGCDTANMRDVMRTRVYDRFPDEFDPVRIVDCGAFIGCSVVYFAERYPAASIVAIEPDAGNFSMLQRNAEPYRGRVELRHAGVWGPHAGGLAYKGGSPDWARRYEATEAPSVGVVDLDTLWPDETIDLLKIDIEGAERHLFDGQPEWLERTRAVVIELHGADCENKYHAAVGKDFRTWREGELTFSIRESWG